MSPLNVIIPMAGLGSRFLDYGFTINKYLLPIDGFLQPMIKAAILTLKVPVNSHFIFILREPVGPDLPLRKLLEDICQDNNYICSILTVDHVTEGPTCTAMIAADLINNDTPLLISNSDQILDLNFDAFMDQASKADGTVLTYNPAYELVIGSKDKNSFVGKGEDGKPNQFAEKIVLSKEALVGVHYYKKGSYFIETANYTFRNNMRAPNGEFYLSLTYQAMLNLGYSVNTYNLSESGNEYYYPVGEPVDYFGYYNKQVKFSDGFEPHPKFLIEEYPSGVEVTFRDEFICILGEEPRMFISGPKFKITMDSAKTILRVPLPGTNKEFSEVRREDFVRGWLIGDFEPSIIRATDFEIGLLHHAAGEKWPFHYHKEAVEINYLLKGSMKLNGIHLSAGTRFIMPRNMIACPDFLENCIILCIKVPSVPKDKYII